MCTSLDIAQNRTPPIRFAFTTITQKHDWIRPLMLDRTVIFRVFRVFHIFRSLSRFSRFSPFSRTSCFSHFSLPGSVRCGGQKTDHQPALGLLVVCTCVSLCSNDECFRHRNAFPPNVGGPPLQPLRVFRLFRVFCACTKNAKKTTKNEKCEKHKKREKH